MVYAGSTQTRVLGTKFDIRSYQSEQQIAVTVSEGKVGFSTFKNKQETITPGQKGTFDKHYESVVKTDNDNQNYMAWKTKEFYFDNQPLETVFQTLGEVYHFKYRFNTQNLKKRMLTANFNHRPLDEIIQTISLSAEVRISIQNGIYSIE